MAAPAKGKRRVKGKTLDLNSFLGDQTAAPGFVVVTPKRDWADCVEEEADEKYTPYRKEEKIVLPTAPKAARGPDFDVSRIPSEPPFTAYIGNLPFDVTEDEIIRFFGNLSAVSVRLPRDGGDRGRMKGFGYAEFETKQALIEALSLNGESLKNRPVRVSLAGENEGIRGDRKTDGIDRTATDWRAAPKSDDSFSRNQRNGGSGTYNRYEDSEREPYRGRNSYGEDRSRYETNSQNYQGRRSTERERDFGSFGNSDRTFGRRYGDSGFDSYERNRGYDRSTRNDRKDDFDSRHDERDSGFERSRRDEYEPRRDKDGERPKERMRLQLKPRTVPMGESATPSSSSSIFGGAKPVDTAAKEREIEQRLAKEREKADDVSKPPPISRETERSYKDDSKKFPDEPLREKYGRVQDRDRSPKVRPNHANVDSHLNSEQQNGQPIELLSNKFAHLLNEED